MAMAKVVVVKANKPTVAGPVRRVPLVRKAPRDRKVLKARKVRKGRWVPKVLLAPLVLRVTKVTRAILALPGQLVRRERPVPPEPLVRMARTAQA